MAKPGPKPGSTQKMRGHHVAEILEERGINLVRKRLDIAMQLEADNKLPEADRVYQDLMKYVYAPRREEDAQGKTADIIAVPMTTEEAKEYIKAARGDR